VPDTANLSIEAKAENATVNRDLAIIRRAFRLAHRAWHVLAIPHN
jgi:CHASE1-domain containing sensor protein